MTIAEFLTKYQDASGQFLDNTTRLITELKLRTFAFDISETFLGTSGTSGTYTPTLANYTNLGSATAYSCRYYRLGDVVTVSGRVDIDPTAATGVQFTMTLPIVSTLVSSGDCSGVVNSNQVQDESGIVNAVGGLAGFNLLAKVTNNHELYFIFTYSVL